MATRSEMTPKAREIVAATQRRIREAGYRVDAAGSRIGDAASPDSDSARFGEQAMGKLRAAANHLPEVVEDGHRAGYLGEAMRRLGDAGDLLADLVEAATNRRLTARDLEGDEFSPLECGGYWGARNYVAAAPEGMRKPWRDLRWSMRAALTHLSEQKRGRKHPASWYAATRNAGMDRLEALGHRVYAAGCYEEASAAMLAEIAADYQPGDNYHPETAEFYARKYQPNNSYDAVIWAAQTEWMSDNTEYGNRSVDSISEAASLYVYDQLERDANEMIGAITDYGEGG